MVVLLSKKVSALEQGSENLNRNLRENIFSVNQKDTVTKTQKIDSSVIPAKAGVHE
jgi:hypothetical protein